MDICLNNFCNTSLDSSIEISLYASITAIAEKDWLRFVPNDNPLLLPSYLKLLEETQQGRMRFIYAVLKEEEVTKGICYFEVVRFTGDNLIAYFPVIEPISFINRIKIVAQKIAKSFIRIIDLELLVSGNLFMTGDKGAFFSSTISNEEGTVLLTTTIQKILKEESKIKAVLFPSLYEPATDADAVFLKDKYRRIFMEADLSMKIHSSWKSFEDYLQALSSKYRVRAKKIISVSAVLTHQNLSHQNILEQTETIFNLYKNVADRVDFNLAKLTPTYFAEQKKLTPDTYQFVAYYLDGKMVGFISLFLLPNKTEVHYVGIDYSINKDYSIYQRMLYDVVKFATEKGLPELHFGRTAPEVKSTIGAIQAPMYGYVKHRNVIFNYFMQLFTEGLKPREYTLRNPFK
jgi:predicted N-acyltransferase